MIRDTCTTRNSMQAEKVVPWGNDSSGLCVYPGPMLHRPHILAMKQPRRPHFIPQWAERRHLSQADLARELGADKGLVSRWFNGSTPGVEWQAALAGLFHCDPEDLFRHPDENWLKRFFDGRSEDEIEHIKRSLEVIFPKKTGTNG